MYLLEANQDSCWAAEANSVEFSASSSRALAWTCGSTWTGAGLDGVVGDDVSGAFGTATSSIAADFAGWEIETGGVWVSAGAAATAAAVLLSSAIAGEFWTTAGAEEEF